MPVTPRSTGNYHVTQKQGKKVKVLRVKSALYNPGDFSITISVGGFKTGKPARVTITGLDGADERNSRDHLRALRTGTVTGTNHD